MRQSNCFVTACQSIENVTVSNGVLLNKPAEDVGDVCCECPKKISLATEAVTDAEMVKPEGGKENSQNWRSFHIGSEIFCSSCSNPFDVPFIVGIANSLRHNQKNCNNHDVRHNFGKVRIIWTIQGGSNSHQNRRGHWADKSNQECSHNRSRYRTDGSEYDDSKSRQK